MSRSSVSIRLAGATLVALAFSSPVAAQALPEAKDVLARYREAAGMAKYAAVKSMHATGEFSIPAAGMTGQLEVWSTRPNRTAMKVTIAGFGEIRSGFTGEAGWSINPMEGPRLMEGAEGKQAADEADFESHLRPDARIASATTVEKTTLDGTECYNVKIVWKSGRETLDCFGTQDGLIVASAGTNETAMGALQATTLMADYRLIDGVRIPTRLTTRIMGAEQIIVLRDIHFNMDVEAALEPPAEIKALIRK
ncbi:MAG TPA: hypothetical protein VMN60_08210 [Longimicrobiales bacterium]|nr:hypothetical protein [Longimicrobiales bacterium]